MAKKKKRITKRKRDWLNPLGHDDTGHISIFTQYVPSEERGLFDGNLDIADCSRKVCLDLSIFPASDRELDRCYKERKKKIAIIRGHLDALEEQMDKFYEHFSNKQ